MENKKPKFGPIFHTFLLGRKFRTIIRFWTYTKTGDTSTYKKLLRFLGNKPKTLNEKKNVMNNFQKWCEGQNLNFEVLKNDDKAMGFRVVQYLESYRVKDRKTNKLMRPKTNTLNKMKSMLKSELAQFGKYLGS